MKKVFDLSGTMENLENNNTTAESITKYNKLILNITQKIEDTPNLPLKTYFETVKATLTQRVAALAALVAQSD